MTFDLLGLSQKLLSALTAAGYQTPTPIQKTAIPAILTGHDILGIAQTGTGKTASFTLPMIDILAESPSKARMPRSLILEPTRELAVQIQESFRKYGQNHKLTTALLIGGTSLEEQAAQLDRGVDVLIATPGRLIDHYERGNLMMNGVEILVIDEADRMLDMGFIPEIEKIRKLIPKKPQVLFFSATMPTEIKSLAETFLVDPKVIEVAPPNTTANTIIQNYVLINADKKIKTLKNILLKSEVYSALIFCNRKIDVTEVYRALKSEGFDASELHGDMPQSSRLEVLNAFKAGDIRFLVASDVAARGLDIPDVSHVINFDMPQSVEDYVHRIGRTGRAGKIGHTILFMTNRDHEMFEKIEKSTKIKILPLSKNDGDQEIENIISTNLNNKDDAVRRKEHHRNRRLYQQGRSNKGGKHNMQTEHFDQKLQNSFYDVKHTSDNLRSLSPAHSQKNTDLMLQSKKPIHHNNQSNPTLEKEQLIGFGENIPAFLRTSKPRQK